MRIINPLIEPKRSYYILDDVLVYVAHRFSGAISSPKGLHYVLSRIKRPDHEGEANGGQAGTSIQYLIIPSPMVY